MNAITPVQIMTPRTDGSLKLGNAALRAGNLEQAIQHYLAALAAMPGLSNSIAPNLNAARQKYRDARNSAVKPRVAVCGWELSHNAAGRAYTLATIYETFAEVEIIGCHFPALGRDIWEPIRDTSITKHSFVVEDEAKFIDQAIALVAAHPYDIVHLSKPRAPNIFFGILYKLIWNAKVLMDIDDEELAFVGAETPISVDDYIKQNGKLPELKDLAGKDWTRLSVGLAKEFDGITVGNTPLQQRYGGEIIRHARDEKQFRPSPELKRKNREKYGIPLDKKVVLFCGTPLEHKGLIETAQAIADTKRSDILFCIAGDFANPALKKKLREIKGCQFVFLSNQPFGRITEVVSMADCCVLMQDEKSVISQFQTPAKLSDALGMGVFVITNSVGVLDGVKGLRDFVATEPEELSKRIKFVLFDDALIRSYQSQALQVFKDRFTTQISAPILENLYKTTQARNLQIPKFLKIFPLPLPLLSTLVSNDPADQTTPHLFIGKLDVDVVVPVFNALQDVKQCMESLNRCTDALKVRIIVVNDGSDQPTTDWLRSYCAGRFNFHLIEHEKNSGYTKAVNTGLRFSTAPYVITQNSDTIVSEGWLSGLIRCMESDKKIGIVGPLSNAASWQNVPHLLDDKGTFAVNELPSGVTVAEMARLVERASVRSYPRLPFANGFCFMIRREVIDIVGYMDEENFPVGYGEENDFCIRATDAGFELAIADDVYVFHAKSKSFGHQQRKVLSEQGSQNLKKKHTPEKFKIKLNEVKKTAQLDLVRARVQDALATKALHTPHIDMMTMRILFLLPVQGGSGGAHSVVQEVTEMRRLGMHAHIAMKHGQVNGFVKSYADIPGSIDTFIGFDNDNLLEIAEDFDIVVGTIYSSMSLVKRINDAIPYILPAYYIQDYEPLFFEEGTPNWRLAHDSYTLVPSACLFAKTHWIIKEVNRHHGVLAHKVQPSIDHEVYRPQLRTRDGRIHITAMIRPQTPRRGAERTMRLFARLHGVLGNALVINLFGCPSDLPEFELLNVDFTFVNHGLLSRTEVTRLLGKSDLFLDLSDYQAFGRTALEAMACGCAAVVPAAGGADEYARNNHNAVIVDTTDEQACFEAVYSIIDDPARLKRLQRAGLETAAQYSVHAAAVSELLVLEDALASLRAIQPRHDKHTLITIPSLTKGGTPTGSAYVRVLLPYNTVAIRRGWKMCQSVSLPMPGPPQVVLIQREAINIKFDALQAWLPKWRASGSKLVFEIDDDLMDEEALKERRYQHDIAETVQKVRYLAQRADLVLVSTEPLAKKFYALNKNVQVIPNALDAELWRLNKPRTHTEGQFKRDPLGPVRIGYIGTSSHHADLELIRQAMRTIEEKYGTTVEIEVVGAFQDVTPTFGKRVGLPKKNDYPNFVNWLDQRVHWDIGVIPLTQEKFNFSKSYLKFLEYAALDMAIVVSEHETYRAVAIPEKNCLVATDTVEAWVKQLSRLIDDIELRTALSIAARKSCIEQHTLEKITPKILNSLDDLMINSM
ncbi:MAG: glycosyltransferase [Pseudomonadota bacterium]